MSKSNATPRQHTLVLMRPIDRRRAAALGRLNSTDALLELVLGIAGIENHRQRQRAALVAALNIYARTRDCKLDLARFMAETYKKEQK